jgi:hypothetical protein
MNSNDGNLFAGIPAALPVEQFDPLLQAGACRLERIISIGLPLRPVNGTTRTGANG